VCKIIFSFKVGDQSKIGKFEHPSFFMEKALKITLLLLDHRRKIPILHISWTLLKKI